MESWEDLDDEKVVAVAQGAFDIEDEDGEVLDSWEDQEEVEDKQDAAPAKKKKNLNQIIQERKEAEDKKKKEIAEKKAAMEAELEEDPATRKARLAKAVQESDFKNATDLFDGISLSTTSSTTANTTQNDIISTVDKSVSKSILDGNPATKDELDNYADTLIEKTNSFKIKNTQRVAFLERALRGMVDKLDFSDIRKLSSLLSTISNEKQRSEKDKKTGKGKSFKKATLKVENNAIEVNNDLDDYDDFM